MNDYRVNLQDARLNNIQRDDFDCFTFDSLSVSELKRILKGKSVLLNKFLLDSEETMLKTKERHILSKVRLIDNIVKNDPYTKAFLVFQTISWKIKKTKMPFILIPVRIFDEGTKVVRDGEPFINPLLEYYIDDYEYTITEKSIFGLDNSELFTLIEESNGRLIYEMYLTHFKVMYFNQKAKINKRFVQVENKIDYLEKNNDLIPMDFELINIKKAVIDGNNTLVNAKQGTKKVALIVNLFAEFIARNKSILYVSEKNYRSLRESIQNSGLSKFIDDLQDTHYNDLFDKDFNDEVSYKELEETVNLLNHYQENFKAENKGFTLSTAFTELVLLRDLPQKDAIVEFFDDLSHKDIENIRTELGKLQFILDQEKYKVPADERWNDIDVRPTRYKETEVVETFKKTTALIAEVIDTINMVNNEYGITLSKERSKLAEFLQNLDFMNSLQYPSSWFKNDNFEKAKQNINRANTLAGRTMSLFTTINMNYESSILDVDPEKIVESIYGEYFTDEDHKQMNKILKSRNYVKAEIHKLQSEVERLLYFKEEFENHFKMELGDDFVDYIPRLCKLLFDPLLKLSWLNFSDDQVNEIIQIFEQNKEVVNKHLKLSREVKSYFNNSIKDVELSFLEEYYLWLEAPKKSSEASSLQKLIEQHALGKYSGLNKKRKLEVIQKVITLKHIDGNIEFVENLLIEKLDKEVELIDFNVLYELFVQIMKFDRSKHLEFTYNIQELKNKLSEFNHSLQAYRYILKDSIFGKLREKTIEDLEHELDLFKNQSNQLIETEEMIKGFFKKTPEHLSVQEMITVTRTVRNYLNNERMLNEKFDEYRLLYGDSYVGKETTFKGIRISIANFDHFMGMFVSKERAEEYFVKKEFKIVNESLYHLRLKLVDLDDYVDELDHYFVDPIRIDHLEELKVYIESLSSQPKLVKWVEFMDGLQALRNYNQLRLAADINNGFITSRLVEQFNYAFYKKFIEEYYHGFNNRDIVERMRLFNQLNRRVHNMRIKEIRSLRRRKKVVLSNVSGIERDKNQYDLVIIDGAERMHSSYMQKVISKGKTALVVFDDESTRIEESMLQYLTHQPLYTLLHNYRISPNLSHGYEIGILHNQTVEVTKRLNVIEKVVEILTTTEKRVNVVCMDNRERVEIFNLINARVMKSDSKHKDVVNRLYVLLDEEYIPSADMTFLLVTEEDKDTVVRAINTTLMNSRDLIIFDERDYLEEFEIKHEFERTLMDIFDEAVDRLSMHVVNELNTNLTVRKMLSPYDFVLGYENEIACMVKITFNNNTKSDILEETLMLFDEEYDHLTKFIISLDDLYFRHDEIINELREVVENGNRK